MYNFKTLQSKVQANIHLIDWGNPKHVKCRQHIHVPILQNYKKFKKNIVALCGRLLNYCNFFPRKKRMDKNTKIRSQAIAKINQK